MENKKTDRLGREDWIRGALEILRASGIEGVKIVPLAKRLGVTSGSFYWHFKNRKELHLALLEYWERTMTDSVFDITTQYDGSPKERIWLLMENVMVAGLARLDLAIWHWAQSDATANTVYKRVLDKRFVFATWMFKEAGFGKTQAEARGRLMVAYMMGESTLISDSPEKRKKLLRVKYEILIGS
jgi:AcrR family transcriptional regulator